MKLEVELEDNIYNKAKEILGDDVDIGRVMSEMICGVLVILAAHPEDFIAVFTRQASPEQRQRIDDAMDKQASRALERAREVKQ